jgi:hypothetical protein
MTTNWHIKKAKPVVGGNANRSAQSNFARKVDEWALDKSSNLLLSILRKHRKGDCLQADIDRPFLVRQTATGFDILPIRCNRLDCDTCAPKIIDHYRSRLTAEISGRGLYTCYTFTLPPSWKRRETYQRMQKGLRYFREWYRRTTGSALTFIRVFGISDNSMDVHLVTDAQIDVEALSTWWHKWTAGRKVHLRHNSPSDIPALVQYLLCNYAEARLSGIKRAINASRNIDIRYKIPAEEKSGFTVVRANYRDYLAALQGVTADQVSIRRLPLHIPKPAGSEAKRSDSTAPSAVVVVPRREDPDAAGGGTATCGKRPSFGEAESAALQTEVPHARRR